MSDEEHYWDLIWSGYRPGDMAHPVAGFDWRAAVRDPDNWVSAFMLGLMLVACLIWMAQEPVIGG